MYTLPWRCRPLLFVGPTGTGKSVYVQDKLMHDLPKEKFLPAFVNFSAQTSANQTQVNKPLPWVKPEKHSYQ